MTIFDRSRFNHDTQEILSVSALNSRVRRLIELSPGQVWVRGEVSNFVAPSSGHWYFTLKDANAQVRCAFFKNRPRTFTRLKEGDDIIVQANTSLYEGRGDYQLIVTQVTWAGKGTLLQAFEKLREKLQKEGLFASQHKRPIPAYPQHLGVITSATGAAIQDIIAVLKRRLPSLPITIFPAPVQGVTSTQELIKALQNAQDFTQCDVLIIGRGGGSYEDLWSFNDESLARAVFACPIPTISAVGHESDFCLVDFVADLRAATPTAAAELVCPHQNAIKEKMAKLLVRQADLVTLQIARENTRLKQAASLIGHFNLRLQEMKQHVDELDIHMHHNIQRQRQRCKNTLQIMYSRLLRQSPQYKIDLMKTRLPFLTSIQFNYMNLKLQELKNRLDKNSQKLHITSPLATLERGYAIAINQNKKIIKKAKETKIGEKIDLKLSVGNLVCRVLTQEKS